MDSDKIESNVKESNLSNDLWQCPTCDTKIQPADVADHCKVELERLTRLQLNAAISNGISTVTSEPENGTEECTTSTSASNSVKSSDADCRKPWSVFQRVQRNRQTRQSHRARKRVSSPSSSTAVKVPKTVEGCPKCNSVCNESKIRRHTDWCTRKLALEVSNATNERLRDSSSDEHDFDDDDEEEYEEYEWAGQKRIRVASLVQGGYASLGIGQTIKYMNNQSNDDDDSDLNVDEDDTNIYGPVQFSETDVIPLTSPDNLKNTSGSGSGESDVTSYMRRLISSSDTTTATAATNEQQHSNTTKVDDVAPSAASTSSNANKPSDGAIDLMDSVFASKNFASSPIKPAQHYQQVIESLKAKLRLVENQAYNKYKCLICMDDYKNPAISVSCWHVYCEQCWLRTLGARKLCPQCNTITIPKDLRRIYL